MAAPKPAIQPASEKFAASVAGTTLHHRPRQCDEPGCGKRHEARGKCATHYMALKRAALEAKAWDPRGPGRPGGRLPWLETATIEQLRETIAKCEAELRRRYEVLTQVLDERGRA